LPDIFISYAREDQATARRFAEAFEREGLSVWWDASLNPGEAFDEVTEKALEEARAVVVLWSKKSVASRWVRAEATQAHESKTLVPVMIEPCKRPIMFELTHTVDLSQWNGDPGDKAWQSYLAGVRRFVNKESPDVTAAAPAVTHHRIGWRVAAIAAVGLLIVGAGVWMLGRRSVGQTNPASQEVTLAVLPFANLSSDPEQEYFSDGLTEEILNQLAQVKELRVTARTSSFSFKGKNEDVRAIAQKLGVANLLEGSIRKDGKSLRITAQLVNGKDGGHLWSQTYDRELSGVFALQEEIAKDVARALSITLDVGETSRANGGTTNVEAFDKYLRAQALSMRGSINDLPQAAQLLREAVALDPNFTVAWLSLRALLVPMASWYPQNAAALLQEGKAIAARLKTLPLDTVSAQAMQAGEFSEAHQWAEAIAAVEPMMAAGPSSQGALFQYALLLRAVGRANASLAYYQRLIRLDPLSLPYSFIFQQALLATGRRAEARVELERLKGLTSNQAELRNQEEYLKWLEEGSRPVLTSARLKSLLQTQPGGFMLPRLFATLAAKPDDVASARAALREAFEDPANQSDGPLTRIIIWADVYGDKDLALAAIRRDLVDLHSGWVATLWEPYWSGLRADPRFKDIVRDLKIADYWRSSGNWGDFCKPVGNDDFECH
jgi:TolB-like protein